MPLRSKIAVLTGAGISAESGIATFRDADGLWENHRVEDVASPEGFARDPRMVLRFYNLRRAQLHEVEPNEGHRAIVRLEDDYDVTVVTQNIDDLHERAGSSRIIHLHGELRKAKAVGDSTEELHDWPGDLNLGDLDDRGRQLRPHVVWFGEDVPEIVNAARVVAEADAIVIVGTSMRVYPAAALVGYADPVVPVVYVDPKPTINWELERRGNIHLVEEVASTGMVRAAALLRELT